MKTSEPMMQFRGELVVITDVSIMEDMSVGIPRHVEDFNLRRQDGSLVSLDIIETMTDEEYTELNDVVWEHERSIYFDWPTLEDE